MKARDLIVLITNTKFAFHAYYDDIRNIEVEPGIIQILSDEEQKEEDNDNVTILDSKELFTDKKDILNINNNISIIEKDRDSLISNRKFKQKKILPYNKNNKTFLKIKNAKGNLKSKLSKSKITNNYYSSRITRQSSGFNLNKKRYKLKKLIANINKPKIEKINNNKYKTLEEIMKEIKSQEDVFNNESINFIKYEMVKESDQTDFLMKKLKDSFSFRKEKPKRPLSSYGFLYNKNRKPPSIV